MGYELPDKRVALEIAYERLKTGGKPIVDGKALAKVWARVMSGMVDAQIVAEAERLEAEIQALPEREWLTEYELAWGLLEKHGIQWEPPNERAHLPWWIAMAQATDAWYEFVKDQDPDGKLVLDTLEEASAFLREKEPHRRAEQMTLF